MLKSEISYKLRFQAKDVLTVISFRSRLRIVPSEPYVWTPFCEEIAKSFLLDRGVRQFFVPKWKRLAIDYLRFIFSNSRYTESLCIGFQAWSLVSVGGRRVLLVARNE